MNQPNPDRETRRRSHHYRGLFTGQWAKRAWAIEVASRAVTVSSVKDLALLASTARYILTFVTTDEATK